MCNKKSVKKSTQLRRDLLENRIQLIVCFNILFSGQKIKKFGLKMGISKAYLLAYNVSQFCGWTYLMYRLLPYLTLQAELYIPSTLNTYYLQLIVCAVKY